MPVLTSGDQLTMSVPYPFTPETTRLPGELPPAQTLERLSELATTAALSQLSPLSAENPLPMLPQLKEGEERKSDFDDIQWNEKKGELPRRKPDKSGINKDGSEEKSNNGNGDDK